MDKYELLKDSKNEWTNQLNSLSRKSKNWMNSQIWKSENELIRKFEK